MGYITDLLAPFVTIVLFIILAYKIYKNTKMMRGTAEKSTEEKAEDFMHGFVDQPELWVKLAKGLKPESAEEDARMSLLVTATYRGYDAQCAQLDAGKMDAGQEEALHEAVHRICAMPGVGRYLPELKPQLSACLQKIINEND